ncbi:hypothetical protein M3Y95_00856600 [Aphelenchoides besseyi]|nr:hypothetical protein M3Y95_00856600 [Aphelenchoides besseyi]
MCSFVNTKNGRCVIEKSSDSSLLSFQFSGQVEELNIRVQGRNTNTAPKGILDTLRDSVVSRGPDQKIDIKDTLKRPLTGLFRRTKPQPPAQPQVQQTTTTSSTAFGHNFQGSAEFDVDAEDTIGRDFNNLNVSALDDNASVLNLNPNNYTGSMGLDTIDFSSVDFGKFEDIDISCLARLICVQSEIMDEEEPWTWDSMFASVTSEMREEWAQEDDEGETTEIVNGLNLI